MMGPVPSPQEWQALSESYPRLTPLLERYSAAAASPRRARSMAEYPPQGAGRAICDARRGVNSPAIRFVQCRRLLPARHTPPPDGAGSVMDTAVGVEFGRPPYDTCPHSGRSGKIR